VRGIHLSAWVAGSRKARGRIDALFSETELNTVVIAVKETKGEVFVPGVPLAEKHGLFVNAVPDLRAYLARLKKAGVYPIARIVVFKDDLLVQARPDLAVRDPDGNIWRDKRGNGWGRGDALHACQVGKGNCTDFHALFISLAKASGIPARFFMGFPLPKGPSGELPAGYHCWAEFYVAGRGWIPVDASEGRKNKDKSGYFFGNLDPDRVLMSEGRGIRLSPQQAGPDLNYLSNPYVEIDGKPFDRYKLERTYKNTDIKGEEKL